MLNAMSAAIVSFGNRIKKSLERFLQPIAVKTGSYLHRFPPKSELKRKQDLQKWADLVVLFLFLLCVWGLISKISFIFLIAFIFVAYFFGIRPKMNDIYDKLVKYTTETYIKERDERKRKKEEALKLAEMIKEAARKKEEDQKSKIKSYGSVISPMPPRARSAISKHITSSHKFYPGFGFVDTDLSYDPRSERRILRVSTARSSIYATIDGLITKSAGEITDLISNLVHKELQKGNPAISEMNFTVCEDHIEVRTGSKVAKYPIAPPNIDVD